MANEEQKPRKAFGRHLSDLWLDGETGKLHPAERKLLDCAARGEPCVLGQERPALPNAENLIRAELLRFIALGGDEQNPLHDQGIKLFGAFVECVSSSLDFEGCQIPENFWLIQSHVDGDVVLQDCLMETINLQGSKVKGISADRCESTGGILLRQEFWATDVVRFAGAKIGGDFSCNGSRFDSDDVSLHCDGFETSGNVFLNNGFHASGTVRLLGAKIKGLLGCDGSRFNGSDISLFCDRLVTSDSVFLANNFNALGAVRFLGARVGGDLVCRKGTFENADTALSCQGARIEGAVFLDGGFLAFGLIDLTAASIGSHLEAVQGTFSKKGISLNAPRLTVGGNLNFGEECRTAGQLSFQGAKIGGDVTFAKGSFEGQPCINLRNAAIDGMLVWRSINHARGELNLSGASCRTLNMDFESWEKPSKIRLDNFTYKGFSELPKGCNTAFWKNWLERQPDNHLEEKFRPKPYSQLADVLEAMGHEEEAVSIRVERRRRQAYFTRKYESRLHDENGNGSKKAGARNANGKGRFFHLLTIIWNVLQGALVDYGYRPGKAVLYLLVVIALGTGVYQWAAWQGIMTPTHPLIFKEAGISISEKCARNWVYPGRLAKTEAAAKALEQECAAQVPSEYSTFSALIYSADVALPIVNFRMENDWSPRVVDWRSGVADYRGWWVRTWEWVQIALGWLLSLLFASAIGGIIRR